MVRIFLFFMFMGAAGSLFAYDPSLTILGQEIREIPASSGTRVLIRISVSPRFFSPSNETAFIDCQADLSWAKFSRDYTALPFDRCRLREGPDGVWIIGLEKEFPRPAVSRTYEVDNLFVRARHRGQTEFLSYLFSPGQITFDIHSDEPPEPIRLESVTLETTGDQRRIRAGQRVKLQALVTTAYPFYSGKVGFRLPGLSLCQGLTGPSGCAGLPAAMDPLVHIRDVGEGRLVQLEFTPISSQRGKSIAMTFITLYSDRLQKVSTPLELKIDILP